MKKKKWIYLFIVLFACATISAVEGDEKEKEKKYHLSICSLFKNEGRFLKEWIEYHRLVGVDHFYLYDLESTDNSREVVAPYIKEGVVTLVNWPEHRSGITQEQTALWVLSRQLPAYEHAIKTKAVNESDWIVIVNVDEFLVSPQEETLLSVLERYQDYPGLILGQEHFDASQEDAAERKLLIQTSAMTQEPRLDERKKVVKTIFKPEYSTAFTWAPYQVIFKNLQTARPLNKQELRVNHYTNRDVDHLFYVHQKEKADVDHRYLSEEDKKAILALDFVIEDQEKAIHRFVPQMLSKMGYE